MAEKLAAINTLVCEAADTSSMDESQSATATLMTGDAEALKPAFWERLRAEVLDPLALRLKEEAAAEEADPSKQAQLAVDTAEALATRPCAHVCCTTIVGAREAESPRGKLCSGCRVVRYCGAACQKADWRAHKAACRELQRRRGGEGSSA